MQWGRVTANPQAAEQGLETVLLIAVVVGVEHAKEYALSEATRTDEEQVVWLFLQFRQEHCLVYIILVLLNDGLEVGHAVWYSFCLLFHDGMVYYAKIGKNFESVKLLEQILCPCFV